MDALRTSPQYGFPDFDPARPKWPKAQYLQLDRQIIELLEGDNPQSVRHVYYCMTRSDLPAYVLKNRKGYRKVQNRIKLLRERGKVPYGHIVDLSRRGWLQPLHRSVKEWMIENVYSFRYNLWAPTGTRCELWCESDSLASVLWETCRKWGVSCFPTRGFSSESFVYDAAEMNNNRFKPDRLIVLYVGDHDPSGLDAFHSLKKKMAQHMDIPWEMRHLGITPEQIIEYDLPGQELKDHEMKKGQRYGITEGVEGEALPAHIMREIVQTEIESLLPPFALELAGVEEESARDVLLDLADMA